LCYFPKLFLPKPECRPKKDGTLRLWFIFRTEQQVLHLGLVQALVLELVLQQPMLPVLVQNLQ
jgi:hypothetical protein